MGVRVLVVAAVALLFVIASTVAPALASPLTVEDPGLSEVIANLLSSNCAGLGGSSNTTGYLRNLCQIPGTQGGAGGAATPTVDSRIGAGEDIRRVRKRVEERRQASASADSAGIRGLSFFASADWQRFDKDETRFETGYKRDTTGGTVGADYSFGSWLAGIAVNYAHEFGDYDGVAGGFDTDAYGFALYASVLPFPNFFVDVIAGYVRKDYDFERRATIAIAPDRHVAGTTHASTSGDEVKFSVQAGYDFVIDRLTIGPRLGVNYRDMTIDAFQERGGTGLELAYGNQNVTSLTTVAGIFASYAIGTTFGVIVPQGTFEYVHEFLDDQRSVSFRFLAAPTIGNFLFRTEPPDRDYFNLNVGAVFVLPNGLAPFINYRELIGYSDRSSHTVSLGLRVSF
jgi:outer membrane autotransporter protein